MSRLVIVSNRVPSPREREASAGGLVVALADGLPEGTLWFGWSGRRSPDPAPPSLQVARGVTYATIDLTEAEYRTYYLGFANAVLYPTLLCRPGLMQFRTEDFEGYGLVNARFAATLVPQLRPEDRIWIHDYLLLILAEELRARGVRNPIGMFLHTPFPPAALLGALPRADALLRGLCAVDVAGFQTAGDRAAFIDCAVHLAGAARLGDDRLILHGHRVRTVVTPVGVDAEGFAATARQSVAEAAARRLAGSLGERKLAISVDRLDYTKGLPQRVLAIGRLLERYPQHRRQMHFLQIAAASRQDVEEYQRLRRELDRLVGDLNGRFGEADWTPLRYVTRATRRTTIAGYLRMARIGLVTPLRDGMNLVAKEYVAAQDPADPGVLVLYRFAGAAEDLTEALIVNPMDGDEVVEALHTALCMPAAERAARHTALLAKVRIRSARHFCQEFPAHLDAGEAPGSQPRSA